MSTVGVILSTVGDVQYRGKVRYCLPGQRTDAQIEALPA